MHNAHGASNTTRMRKNSWTHDNASSSLLNLVGGDLVAKALSTDSPMTRNGGSPPDTWGRGCQCQLGRSTCIPWFSGTPTGVFATATCASAPPGRISQSREPPQNGNQCKLQKWLEGEASRCAA